MVIVKNMTLNNLYHLLTIVTLATLVNCSPLTINKSSNGVRVPAISISDIDDQTIVEDDSTGELTFSIEDENQLPIVEKCFRHRTKL